MKLKFRFILAPDLLASETIFYNQATGTVDDVRFTNKLDHPILWQKAAGGYIVHFLESGDVEIDQFEDRMYRGERIFSKYELLKEFKHVVSLYASSLTPKLGKTVPGSWIDIEHDDQKKEEICTGFMLRFEDGPTISRSITSMRLTIIDASKLTEEIMRRLAAQAT